MQGGPLHRLQKNPLQFGSWIDACSAVLKNGGKMENRDDLSREEKAQIRKENFPYFDNARFIPKWLGDKILDADKFVTFTDTEEIFYYDKIEGYYKPAQAYIFEKISNELKEDLTRNRQFEVLNYLKVNSYKDRKVTDPPENLICLKNGILDVIGGRFNDHSPDYYYFSNLPIIYKPQASCSLINKFLTQVLAENDIPSIKEFIGYCLYRKYPIQKAFMFVGEGSNGKSVLLQLIESFLGPDNVSHIPLQRLDDKFSAVKLYQKLANFYADLSPKAFYDTGKFKTIFGDRIQAEKKFQNPFDFTPYAKIAYSANRIPSTEDDTEAFYRRWKVFNFPNTFTEGVNADPNLLFKLTTPDELSGLLNEVIAHLGDLLKRGKFSNSETTDQTRDTWIRLSDSVQAYCMDEIEANPDGFIIKDEGFSKYCEYCKKMNYPVSSKKHFSSELPKHFSITTAYPKIEKRQRESWKGVQYKNKSEGGSESKNMTDMVNMVDFT